MLNRLVRDRTTMPAILQKKNVWILESSLESIDVEDHVKHLISQLSKWPKLPSVLDNFDCVLRCMMEISEETKTTLNLSPETLSALGQMRCSFDLDYYYIEK